VSSRSTYNNRPALSALLDFRVVTDLATEPITLTEVKRHLNMVFDTDGSYEFNDDDTKLTELITEVRQALEKYTGLSFGEKTLQVVISNERGQRFELPYGPVTSVTTVVDKDGEDIGDPVIRGLDFKWIETCSSYMVVTYEAGYSTLPADLKRAMKEEIAFRYKNQGDHGDEIHSASARNLAAKHRRVGWLL